MKAVGRGGKVFDSLGRQNIISAIVQGASGATFRA
jgi:hypothetical protein